MESSREKLEKMTKDLIKSLDSSLKGLFSNFEIEKVKKVSENLINTKSSSDDEQEENLKNKIQEQLEFVNEKINELQEKESERLTNVKNQITDFFEKNSEELTPSREKLQELKNKIKNYLSTFDLNLYNIKEFNNKIINEFESDYKKLIEIAKSELNEQNKEKSIKKNRD